MPPRAITGTGDPEPSVIPIVPNPVKKRPTVLAIATGILLLGLSALAYAALGGAESAAALAIAAGCAATLAALARDIVTVDSAPFDPAAASHAERMAAIEADTKAKLAWHELMGDTIERVTRPPNIPNS